MIVQYLLVTLVALIANSEDFFGTILISRPIVTGPLVGLVLGHPVEGIIIGGTLELVFMGVMSIGAAPPPDIVTAGILGTAFAVMSGKGAAVALALAVPISMLTQMVGTTINVIRSGFNKRFDQLAEQGDHQKIQWLHVKLWLITPITKTLIVFLALLLGSSAMKTFLDMIPSWVNTGFTAAGNLLPAVGVAMLMSLMFNKKVAPYYFLGFALSAYLKLPVIAIGILGVITAIVITSIGKGDGEEVEEESSEDDAGVTDTTVAAGSIISKSDLRKVFFRSLGLEASFNYERMQANGFCFAMMPILKKIYTTKESMAEALQRHLQFFNTTPYCVTFVMGIAASMEVQNSKDEEFNAESIDAVKAGLMGPFAGIFDSLFWGTFRVIAAGVGAQLALKGSVLGPILFLLIFNVPHLAFRYNATFWGFNAGNKFLQKISSGGMMEKVTLGASILGLMVVGGMTASLIPFTTTLAIGAKGSAVKIQTILDQILPNMLPLGLTFLIYSLYKKRVKVTYVMIGVIVLGFLLSVLHVI